jgi:hypothetical protein
MFKNLLGMPGNKRLWYGRGCGECRRCVNSRNSSYYVAQRFFTYFLLSRCEKETKIIKFKIQAYKEIKFITPLIG